jgi:hypothetical protein
VSHHQWKSHEPIYDGEVIVTADIAGPDERDTKLTIEYDHPPYEDITDGPRRLHGEEVKQWEHWLDDLRQQALTLDDEENES